MNYTTVSVYVHRHALKCEIHGHDNKVEGWRRAKQCMNHIHDEHMLSIRSGRTIPNIVSSACVVYSLQSLYTITLPMKYHLVHFTNVLTNYFDYFFAISYNIEHHIDHKFMLHDTALCVFDTTTRSSLVTYSNAMRKAYNKVQSRISVADFIKTWNMNLPNDMRLDEMLRGCTTMRAHKNIRNRVFEITKIDIYNDIMAHPHITTKSKIKSNVRLSDIIVSLYVTNPHILSIYRMIIEVYATHLCYTRDMNELSRMVYDGLKHNCVRDGEHAHIIDVLNNFRMAEVVNMFCDRDVTYDEWMAVWNTNKRIKLMKKCIESIKNGYYTEQRNYKQCSIMYVDCLFALLTRHNINHNTMCAVLLHCDSVYRKNRDILSISIGLCGQLCDRYFDNVKYVNDMLKSGGMGGNMRCNHLVEMQSLYGKYDDDALIDKDITYRISKKGKDIMGHTIPGGRLANAVERIIDQSIKHNGLISIDLEKAWHRRWATCKAGSHKVRDDIEIFGRTSIPSDIKEVTKRHFIENTKKNLLFKTKPKCLISPSVKNENGKNRVIYSCDTVNYLNFDCIWKVIENIFDSERIVLQPGDENTNRMCKKLLLRSGEVNLSLDYEDFNSQHSIRDMKIVVEKLRKYIGDGYTNWLTASFNDMRVYYKNRWHKWLHSLPSGHRLTTFINSILNYAYVSIIMEDAKVYNYDSVHTGDDCVIMIKDVRDVDTVVNACINNKYGLRFNKSKQCLNENFEFLRMSHTQGAVYGYINRSFASLVNGNWTTDSYLSHDEYINCLNQMVYTLYNRGGRACLYGLTCTVMRHLQMHFHEAQSYLDGALSVNNSILFTPNEKAKHITFSYKRYKRRLITNPKHNNYATNDYLTHCITPIERQVIDSGDYYPLLSSSMSSASYANERIVFVSGFKEGNITRVEEQKVIDDVDPTLQSRGVLESSLPFRYLKNVLSSDEIIDIVRALIGTTNTISSDALWGMKSQTLFCRGGIPYGTVMYFSKLLRNGNRVITDLPVFV